MFLVSSCSCFCPIHWSQVLRREWKCSWSSADRQCSNYIWVITNFIAYKRATYRGLTVSCPRLNVLQLTMTNQKHIPRRGNNTYWQWTIIGPSPVLICHRSTNSINCINAVFVSGTGDSLGQQFSWNWPITRGFSSFGVWPGTTCGTCWKMKLA